MCAEPPHDGKEWKGKLIMVYPYYGEKRYILMRNGFLIILMKNVF